MPPSFKRRAHARVNSNHAGSNSNGEEFRALPWLPGQRRRCYIVPGRDRGRGGGDAVIRGVHRTATRRLLREISLSGSSSVVTRLAANWMTCRDAFGRSLVLSGTQFAVLAIQSSRSFLVRVYCVAACIVVPYTEFGSGGKRMALPSTHLIDELATAYVQAMAAAAGCTIAVQRRDYGIDGTFRLISSDDGFYETGYPVDFQLKATSNAAETDTEVVFDLKIANYNKIVTRPANAAPYYLLLVCFSGPAEEWCKISREQLQPDGYESHNNSAFQPTRSPIC